MQERIILGIDPGTNIMGYGIIKITNNNPTLLAFDSIQIKSNNHAIKLQEIFNHCTKIISNYLPDEMAIEAPFYGKNVQSMLKLGRAQGVAIAAAIQRGIPIFEYQPRKIKQSITGNGNASKEQVAAILQSMLHFQELPKHLDATDGLAVALCHYFQGKAIGNTEKTSSWKSFIQKNPDRIQ